MSDNPDKKQMTNKPSGWFDFKGADAAFDRWLSSIRRELRETDRRFDAYLDETDRRWGLKK